jgi:hypothetical protein
MYTSTVLATLLLWLIMNFVRHMLLLNLDWNPSTGHFHIAAHGDAVINGDNNTRNEKQPAGSSKDRQLSPCYHNF